MVKEIKKYVGLSAVEQPNFLEINHETAIAMF